MNMQVISKTNTASSRDCMFVMPHLLPEISMLLLARQFPDMYNGFFVLVIWYQQRSIMHFEALNGILQSTGI
jgi:hypothetical protein